MKRNLFLGLLGLCFGSSLLISCHKRDRLTNSTFTLGITPPAANVLRTGTLTLNAFGRSSSGNVAVSPTWEVSPTTVGTLNNSIGTTVVFTPVALGTAVVTATFDGLQTTAEINVVTYIPSSTVFNVYNDDGLPSISGASESDIFVDPGVSLSEVTSGYTPEGVRYQHTTNMDGGEFWGVTLDKNSVGASRDLSATSGTLKFSIRLVNRTMTTIAGGDHLRIELKSAGAAAVPIDLADGTYNFNRLSTDWQEISIPITDFAGLNTSQIQNPFAIVAITMTSPLDFDIDAIRWEP